MSEQERSRLGRGWRAVERNLSPRVDEFMRTSHFARGIGLLVDVRALTRRQATAATARIWHGLNLPAGSDLARLRGQVGALDHELRRLRMHLEREAVRTPRADTSDAGRPHQQGHESQQDP